jgi:hypothetical protein
VEAATCSYCPHEEKESLLIHERDKSCLPMFSIPGLSLLTFNWAWNLCLTFFHRFRIVGCSPVYYRDGGNIRSSHGTDVKVLRRYCRNI